MPIYDEKHSPFGYRTGPKAAGAARARSREQVRAVVAGNAERPGLDLPPCPDDERLTAAKALDELCAKRPLKPPGQR